MKVLELFEPAAIDVSDEDARMDAVIQALVCLLYTSDAADE